MLLSFSSSEQQFEVGAFADCLDGVNIGSIEASSRELAEECRNDGQWARNNDQERKYVSQRSKVRNEHDIVERYNQMCNEGFQSSDSDG